MVGNRDSRVGKMGFQCPLEFLLPLRLFFLQQSEIQSTWFFKPLYNKRVSNICWLISSKTKAISGSMQISLQEVSIFYSLWQSESIKHLFKIYLSLIRGISVSCMLHELGPSNSHCLEYFWFIGFTNLTALQKIPHQSLARFHKRYCRLNSLPYWCTCYYSAYAFQFQLKTISER